MHIKLSTSTKLGFGSEPTPQSVKDRVSQIEAVILKQIGEFSSFSSNKTEYKNILSGIQEDLRSVRPIIEYVCAENGARAFNKTNIKDTYERYGDLKKAVHGDSPLDSATSKDPAVLDAATQEVGSIDEEELDSEGLGSEEGLNSEEESGAEEALGSEKDDALFGSEEGEALLNALSNAIFVKHAVDVASAPAQTASNGLSDKIEKLYFLGRIDDLKVIREKTNRVIKIGELLAAAINNDGRPTLSSIHELNQACKAAIRDISIVESAVDSLNQLPDKLETIVDLLKLSLLERIKEIKGT